MSHVRALDALVADGMDYLAMGIAFVAYFVISFLWWGPIFGKAWGRLMGFDPDERPPMLKPILLQALASALLVYILWFVLQAFVVTHDTDGVVRGDLGVLDAVIGAFFTWLGFFVPVQLGRVAWEKAQWPLFGINAGGHLVTLVAAGVIFALI